MLKNAGKVQMKVAQKLAVDRYDDLDKKRKKVEALASAEENIKELGALEKNLTKKYK